MRAKPADPAALPFFRRQYEVSPSVKRALVFAERTADDLAPACFGLEAEVAFVLALARPFRNRATSRP